MADRGRRARYRGGGSSAERGNARRGGRPIQSDRREYDDDNAYRDKSDTDHHQRSDGRGRSRGRAYGHGGPHSDEHRRRHDDENDDSRQHRSDDFKHDDKYSNYNAAKERRYNEKEDNKSHDDSSYGHRRNVRYDDRHRGEERRNDRRNGKYDGRQHDEDRKAGNRNRRRHDDDDYREQHDDHGGDRLNEGHPEGGVWRRPGVSRSERYRIQEEQARQVREDKAAEARERERSLQEVARTVKQLQETGQIQDETFNVIHLNILAKSDDVPAQYYPCELGLIQFSLREGVTKELHRFLLSADVPVGYSYQISYDAERTHQLDGNSAPITKLRMEWDNQADRHYQQVLKDIAAFVQKNGEEGDLPPLFTLSEDIEKTRYILKKMNSLAGGFPRDHLDVRPLDQLFYRLCMATPQGDMMSDSILATDKLEQDLYEYTVQLACTFHEEADQPSFCSLMRAKRWAYIICEEVCPHYNIDIRVGRHIPVEVERQEAAVSRQSQVASTDTEWTPDFGIAQASRRSRYVDTTPTNDWGTVKTQSVPAGMMPAATQEWTPVIGRSEHAFSSERKLLEERQILSSRAHQMMDKPGRGGGEASKENWRPLPALYEGPLTSPFAIGRGTVNPTAAQLQRRGLQNSSRGIHSQHAHESALSQNGYGSNGVIPSQGGNELKNPFGRGRGMLPTAIQHRGGSGGTPPPPGGVAMPRDNMVTGSNGTTGVGRGFSQLRIQ